MAMAFVYTAFSFATLQVIVALIGDCFEALTRRIWFRTLENAVVVGLATSAFALSIVVCYAWVSSPSAADILERPKFENRIVAATNNN